MQLALNKYTIRVEIGEWGAPFIEQEQLIALSAELAKFKSDPRFSSRNSRDKKKKDGKSDKGKKAKNKRNDDQWACKRVTPTDGEPNPKNKNGKLYHWCVKHQAWTVHTPSQCDLPDPDEDSSSDRKSQYEQTMHTVMERSDEEIEFEDE